MPMRDDDLRDRYLDLNGWIMSRTDAAVDEKQTQLNNAAVLYTAAGAAPDDPRFGPTTGGDPGFSVAAMYGAATRKGLVTVSMGAEQQTVTPSKAREMATFLLEAASAAEGDEALMSALRAEGTSLGRSARLLRAVREQRLVLFEAARREAIRQLAEDETPIDPEA